VNTFILLLFERLKKPPKRAARRKCRGVPAIVAGFSYLSSEKIARKCALLATSFSNCYCGGIKRCHHRPEKTGVVSMFTGIVQGTAKVVSIDEKPNFRTHVVELPEYMLDGIETGASIAHNGCCLTVTEINGNQISFDLMKETLRITNLGELAVGDTVNVERAAKFSDEIGGHLMSGHIMTTAEVAKIVTSENNRQIWFKVQDPALMKYILYKGFIGIDGISLTVGEVTPTRFCVHLITETLQRTTMGAKKLGHRVNIEIDPQTQAVVDTVERVLAAKEAAIIKAVEEE